MYPLLTDFLILLAVSIPVTYAFHRLRLPTIIGFLATGIIVGPSGAGLIGDLKAVRELADIGVVLLLFAIGLEFSVRHMLTSGTRILLAALAQIGVTIGLTVALSRGFHLSSSEGLFMGFLISLSSTAMVLKSYADRAEVDTLHGRLSAGILLFQDLCVIPMMLISSGLGGRTVHVFPIAKQLALALATLAGLFLAARYVVPLLLRQIVQIRNRDVFLVTILFICLGTAYISASLGLSLAIGAFIAGLVISESVYSSQILSDILPFRDTFNAVFFISIGMLLNVPAFLADFGILTGLTAAIIVAKCAITLVILLLAGYTFRASWITAASLAQVGEFSFLLAREHHALLPERLYQLFLGSSILTLFLTPLAIAAAAPLGMMMQRRFSKTAPTADEESTENKRKNHLLIIGFGLNGQNLSRVVRDIGIPFLVIEHNDKLIQEAQKANVPVLFGDATRMEVLMKAGANFANMAVVAISDAPATRHCVSILRGMNPTAVILVRTRYVAEVDSLLKLGANIVIPEEFETSVEIFARVLQQYGIPDHLIDQQISVIRSDGYGMLRGLSLTQERLLKISELFLKSTVQQLIIRSGSYAKDKTLRDLDLRNKTGASIIAAIRADQAITNPDADFQLREGDIVVVWGAHQQLADASKLLSTESS